MKRNNPATIGGARAEQTTVHLDIRPPHSHYKRRTVCGHNAFLGKIHIRWDACHQQGLPPGDHSSDDKVVQRGLLSIEVLCLSNLFFCIFLSCSVSNLAQIVLKKKKSQWNVSGQWGKGHFYLLI